MVHEMWVTSFCLLLILEPVISDLTISPDNFKLCVNEVKKVEIHIEENVSNANVTLTVDHLGHINISEYHLEFNGQDQSKFVTVTGKKPGKVTVSAAINGTGDVKVKTREAYIIVQKQDYWNIVSDVVGWLYFAAWSISFYPQIYENYKRRSVVGLNFDFLSLNLLGFSLYSLFNIGLYASETVRGQYEERFPKGVIPVQLNDIFFSVHATVAVILTGIQCFIYEKGDQAISILAKCLFVAYAFVLSISLVLAAATDLINWLDFLLYCSYIKLSITLIKYVPQAYMNYKRKSTTGWSIGNIFLDTTGGLLSMIQMIVNAYNFDDWASIFGDPTKFGLGLFSEFRRSYLDFWRHHKTSPVKMDNFYFFSVLFDIFFIMQHYVLYRNLEPVA